MVTTMRENDKTTREQNQNGGSKENQNGGSKENQNGGSKESSRELSKSAAATPVPYRRGTAVSQWAHEPFRRMREEFDRMFEQFFGNWPTMSEGWGRQMQWGLDFQEDDATMIVRAEAPGFEPGDFDVQVRGDQLILHATHKTESQEKQRGDHEWQQQEFYRSISLPSGADHEKVEARYRNWVLSVTLAKTEECKGRHIAVKG